MQKAQQDAWAKRSVWRGVALRDGQCGFNAEQVSFLLLYRIFPHARENLVCPQKKLYSEGKIWSEMQDLWAGGRAWLAGWAWMGAGPGRGGGGRAWNRLECHFGGEYRGENQVFFT